MTSQRLLELLTPEAGATVTVHTRDRVFPGARLVEIGFMEDRPEVVVFDDPIGWLPGRYLVPWIEVTFMAFDQGPT